MTAPETPESSPEGKDKSQQFSKHAWIIVIALAVIFFAPGALSGKTFYAFDTLSSYPPWREGAPEVNNSLITDPVNLFFLAAQRYQRGVRAGELSRWDRSILSGRSGGSSYLSPFMSFLFAVFPVTVAHDLLLFSYLLLSGLGMYGYLRLIKVDVLPSLIGASSWMFNGYCMVWFEFENVPGMAASFSLMLLSIEYWYRRQSLLGGLGMVGASALALTVACHHLLVFQFLFCGFYVLVRWLGEIWTLARRKPEPHKKKKRKPTAKGDYKLPALRFAGVVGALLVAILMNLPMVTGALGQVKPTEKSSSGKTAVARMGQRTGLSFDELLKNTGQLPKKYLLTLAFPGFFGGPIWGVDYTPRVGGAQQPYNNTNELCVYAGIVSLLLSLAAYFRPRGVGMQRFFLIATPVILLMALGTVLLVPVVRFVPGMNISTPTRILYVFGLCMSVLAGLGAQALLELSGRRRIALAAIWTGAAVALVGIAWYGTTPAGQRWAGETSRNIANVGWERMAGAIGKNLSFSSGTLTPQLILAAIALTLGAVVLFSTKPQIRTGALIGLLAVLLTDQMGFGWRYNTTSPRDAAFPLTEGLSLLKETPEPFRVGMTGAFLHNSMAANEIEDIGGYRSFYPKRYADFLYIMNAKNKTTPAMPSQPNRWVHTKQVGSVVQDVLNMRYLLLPAVAPGQAPPKMPPSYKLIYAKEMLIYENLNAFPRAFLVPEFEYAESQNAAFIKVWKMTHADYQRKVILEQRPAEGFPSREAAPLDLAAKVTDITHGPNSVSMDVSTPVDAFLVCSDNYDRRWTAELDGKPVPLYQGNYVMRTVPVPAGVHKLEMRFALGQKAIPMNRLHIWTAWCLYFVAIAGAFVLIWRERRSDCAAPSPA